MKLVFKTLLVIKLQIIDALHTNFCWNHLNMISD